MSGRTEEYRQALARHRQLSYERERAMFLFDGVKGEWRRTFSPEVIRKAADAMREAETEEEKMGVALEAAGGVELRDRYFSAKRKFEDATADLHALEREYPELRLAPIFDSHLRQ